jgi:hypothetical protein
VLGEDAKTTAYPPTGRGPPHERVDWYFEWKFGTTLQVRACLCACVHACMHAFVCSVHACMRAALVATSQRCLPCWLVVTARPTALFR